MFTLLKILCICAMALCAFAGEKKDDPKNEAKSRSWTVEEPWYPLFRNPYNRQPLYTWWAAPWMTSHHHESLVQSHPIHHDPRHHLEAIPVPIVSHPVLPHIPYDQHHHQAKYIAQTLGSIHVAPLLGHTESVISTNLHPAPGRLLK